MLRYLKIYCGIICSQLNQGSRFNPPLAKLINRREKCVAVYIHNRKEKSVYTKSIRI